MNLSAALQDSKENLLFEPGRVKKINAAGSLITYSKNNGREYFYIAGPTTESLTFLVRIKKSDKVFFVGKGPNFVTTNLHHSFPYHCHSIN